MADINIDLNSLVAIIIAKTLEFSESKKSPEEINNFCLNLTKDKDFIKVCQEMVNNTVK